jgi:hypothetical protein
VTTPEQDVVISQLRIAMADALHPVLESRTIPALSHAEAGKVVLWSMLTLAVDVALTLGVELDDVQDFCVRASEYAENAKPVRDAQRMTAHLKTGQA